MSLLCWNCHELGNQHTVNQLADMVWAKDPSILFIAETWMDKVRLTRIQNRLDYRHKFVVPRKNKACGLVLFWKDEFNLEVKTFLKNHIDTTINKTTEDEWRFTGLYDEPDTSKRHESWDRLCNLKNGGSMTWILANDFNEITR